MKPSETKKLIIIDGNAILHRAYHALPPLTDRDGEVVNAVYGFFSMLLKVIQDQRPDYLAVCFDRAAPTIRQSLYAGYHAHRPQLANDFIPQFGKVYETLDKMNVKMFGVDGYEADDVIGTIARRAGGMESGEQETSKEKTGNEKQKLDVGIEKVEEEDGSWKIDDPSSKLEVVIVTGDRDLLQLVNEHTKILMLVTGLSKTVVFDEAAVIEKYGVHPKQFIDYKALIGDASDGYPGVTGIGPKTAASLLQKYQTFENLYEHIGELSEKQGLQLATDAEQAALAKKLATIICDVPMQFALTECSNDKFDIQGLYEGFEKFGFKSLGKRITETFPNFVPNKKQEKEQLALLE